ncbi:MAG: histidine phosphatase family protein [Bacteroidales bacterium]|jgi:phosphohistidine phosphatase|nr:histidine phosphatase family protein [Bacteroidales bacterium]
MKKIIFVRHGRAEDDSGLSDFERSLTPKGKVISLQVAKKFREKEPDPGLLITSPAFRALETAFIFAGELGISHDDVQIDSNMYHRAGMKHLLSILENAAGNIDTITLFGHNPAITEMPDRLSKTGCEFLTKTAVVCISFPVSNWSEVRTGSGKVEYFLKPEKL